MFFFNLNYSITNTNIQEYEYYDIHICLVNMWVSKLSLPITHKYLFPTHYEFYPRIQIFFTSINVAMFVVIYVKSNNYH